jgi:general secretion pathway protein G
VKNLYSITHQRADFLAQINRQCGFTLIELLMTVLMVAVLASVALPLSHLASQRNKETQLREALHQIREAIDAYKHAADSGHIVLKSGESGYPPSLDVLVNGVVDAKPRSPVGSVHSENSLSSNNGVVNQTLSAPLNTVTMNTKGAERAKLFFLRRIPRDPMNDNLDLSAADTWGKRSYASSYENPQEGIDVFDVYSLSSKVGLNKQPYREW